MTPPSTVNAREMRRRMAALGYAVVVLVQLVIVTAGDTRVGVLLAVGVAVARWLLAAFMGAGMRWAWSVDLAANVVLLAVVVLMDTVTGVVVITQVLALAPLLHPALARRDSWVHRWG